MTTEKTTGRSYDKLVHAMMRNWNAERWKPYLESLGLTDEDMVDRLLRILVLHFLLDRTLTAILTVRLAKDASAVSKTMEEVAILFMDDRIRLARVSGVISTSCAKAMTKVNDVRNKIAHFKPKRGWGLANLKALSSEEAFEECVASGMSALTEATKIVGNARH